MEAAPSSILTGLIGIAGLVGGALINHLLAGRQGVDADVRGRRRAVYRELWQMSEVVPKWPRRSEIPRTE